MANYGGTSAATATGTPVSLAFLLIGVWTGLWGILLKSFTASCAGAERSGAHCKNNQRIVRQWMA